MSNLKFKEGLFMELSNSFFYSNMFISFFFNNLIPALFILFIGWFLSGKILIMIKRTLTKSKVDESIISFFSSVLKLVFRIIVILVALTCFGINISSIVATFGAALVTVGLALKDNLSNAASGAIIIINKPFKIGDTLSTSTIDGKVTKIEMLSTTLITSDNREIVVPNSKLTSDYIINSSVNSKRRLDLELPLKKDIKFTDIQPILNNIVNNNPDILSKPAPEVSISTFNDATINVTIKVWCTTENYSSLQKSLLETVKMELDKNNINF